VTLHLHLAECSGPIRFGVQRGHSFFSFVGDPIMRINVRNEIGKGVFHIKDMPQISDFVVKKLKSFIHRKIVHPNCHKFRLIWPRNWWPEGTEDFFMDVAAATNQPSDAHTQKHQEMTGTEPLLRDRKTTGSQSSSPSDSSNIGHTTNQPTNTSSSYENMKHTVSTWLHKGKGSIRGDASSHSGDQAPDPDRAADTPLDIRRRTNASDKVKSLLHTASRSSSKMSFRALSFRNNNNGSEGSMPAAAAAIIRNKHEQRNQPPLTPSSDSLKDSAAWDMAVKSISMKYIELQGAGAGREWTSDDSFFLLRTVPSYENAAARKSVVFVLPSLQDTVRRSAERSLLSLSSAGSAHPHTYSSSATRCSEDDSRLIYQPDFSSERKVTRRHSFDVFRDEPSPADRIRSATLSDLRPDVCEAMFRLHVVSSHYIIAEANEEIDSGYCRETVSMDDRQAIKQFVDSSGSSDEHSLGDHKSIDSPVSGGNFANPRPMQTKIAIVKSKFANFKAKHIRSSIESTHGGGRAGGSNCDGTEAKLLSISTADDHEKTAVPGGAMRYLSAMFRSSSSTTTPGK